MPQGIIIAVTPIRSIDDFDPKEEDRLVGGCAGTVRITTEHYAGRIGYYRHRGQCCRARSGQHVDLEVIREEKDGTILVNLINCDNF